MKARFTEVLWLDAQQEIPLAQLAELSGLSEAELRALTEYGVLPAVDPAAGQPSYRTDCVVLARTARRLRSDLELNMDGLALVMNLLGRMHGLEAELNDLRAKSPAWDGL